MEKKYVLVEVGGHRCPLVYSIARGLYCGIYLREDKAVPCNCEKCTHGHTDKEIIERRAEAMYRRFEKVGCTSHSWSEVYKHERDSFLKAAATTLKADLEAGKK
jgi:hypothetical protein